MERVKLNTRVQHSKCPYCHDVVRPHEPKTACETCMAWHHKECWDETGTCSSCLSDTVASRPPRVVRPAPPRGAKCKTAACNFHYKGEGTPLNSYCLECRKKHTMIAVGSLLGFLVLLFVLAAIF